MESQAKTATQGRLLLVTRDVDGGLGQHVVDLAEGMAARGWEVHCIRAERAEDHVTAHSARLEALPGVTVHTIPLARAIGPGDLRSYLAFRRIVKRHGPFDIAHGHGAKGGVFVRLPCRGIGASVYTPHGLMTVDTSFRGPKAAVYGLIERLFARLFTQTMIVVSEEERDEGLRLGAAPETCHLVPNGRAEPALIDRDRARAKIGIPKDAEVALFVGRFVYAKAPERFVRLVAKLAPDRPKLLGLLIGSGEARPALDKIASEEGILDRLVFFETDRAATYMKAADVLVMPSRYEGLAYTMIEGLAAGLPIVSTVVPGASMGIVAGQNGYVVPQNCQERLVESCAALLDDPGLRHAMGSKSRARFARFELRAMVDATAAIYEAPLQEVRHRAGGGGEDGRRLGRRAERVHG